MASQTIVQAIREFANELKVPVKSLFQYYTHYAVVAGWTNLIIGCVCIILLALVTGWFIHTSRFFNPQSKFDRIIVLILSMILIGALAIVVGTYVPWIYAPKASAINIITAHIASLLWLRN